jgi:hypothetical protein
MDVPVYRKAQEFSNNVLNPRRVDLQKLIMTNSEMPYEPVAFPSRAASS